MDDFQILFVDDDQTILNMVEEYLSAFDYRVTIVDSGLKALELIKDKDFDVVFTDFKMPDIDGLELLAMIKEYRPATEVIIVTGHGTMESAIQAMKFGSYDYIQKPFKLDVLKIVINKLYEEKKLKRENIVLRTRVKQRHKYDQMVGISLRMQEIYEQIDHMQNASPNVLIQGESGTGKELAAHVIHRTSLRNHLPLTSVNCKSFGKGLVGDQLYAHALELFQAAANGTIFFNEITEIMPADQAEINRAYMENKFKPGSDNGNPQSGVRLLVATAENLDESTSRGSLNPDFLSAINEVKIQMPSLRERREDISLLINHFLNKFNAKNDNKVLNVSPEAMDVLLQYNWPGNVIQLENVIERAFALRVDLIIDVDDLPSEIKTFGEISKMG